jgi:hypothetical protein
MSSLEALLNRKDTLKDMRHVFTREMPYGTHLETQDAPASVIVRYKGNVVLSVTHTLNGPLLSSTLTPSTQDEVVTLLTSLIPALETCYV